MTGHGSLKWRPVTRGEARGGWQADGQDDVYLTCPTATGGFQLCRRPRGLPGPADWVPTAVATSIPVDSLEAGRRLAARYGAGLSIGGESAWTRDQAD